MEKPYKRTTVYMPEGLHQAVKIYCATEGVSLSEITRKALEKMVGLDNATVWVNENSERWIKSNN